MNHRDQRAYRMGEWKYLKVDEHEYLFNIVNDARERANQAKNYPDKLTEMRQVWIDWNDTIPSIPEDASVSLGYGRADMPQR
jgi:arylsulfatase A-like enzyme